MVLIGTDIKLAKEVLDRGDLVGIPTETVYGLAGNALDPKAVAKIFSVKKRPSFDPLIVHVASSKFLGKIVAEVPTAAQVLIDHFWPGPLTLVLPKKNNVPDLVTSGLATVGVRNPSHPMTLQLLQQLDYPLASPSANPFGYISPTTAEHVATQLGNDIPYILDGGCCEIGVESTIIGFDGQQPVLLRPGGISLEAIAKLVGRVTKSHVVENVSAPGMLESHYAPGKTLLLGNIPELIEIYSTEKAGVLSMSERFEQVDYQHQIQLSIKGDLSEAAQNLFGSLRKLDAMPITYIFAEPVPNHGLGLAINDRLRRAASKA